MVSKISVFRTNTPKQTMHGRGKELSKPKTLIHCNVLNNSYQQKSRVLYTFIPNKSLGQLLDISPEHFISLKTFDSEFSYIEV